MTVSATRRVFGSIFFKFAIILLALGASTAAAVGVGLLAFSTLFGSMQTMTNEVLPKITSSFDIIEKTGVVRSRVAELGRANTVPELNASLDQFDTASGDLADAITHLDSEVVDRIAPMIDALNHAARDEVDALEHRFRAEARMLEQIDAFRTLGADARGQLAELTDNAVFDLTLGGEDTVSSVNDTLATLTDETFATMQAALNLRSELNLTSGIALALARIDDAAFASILQDLQKASLHRLTEHLETLEGNAETASVMLPVREAYDFLKNLSQLTRAQTARQADKILTVRQSSDAALAELTDNLSFDLVILAEDTAEGNETAIQNLLDKDVGNILRAAAIDNAVQQVFVSALLGVIADDPAGVDGAQAALNEHSAHLQKVFGQIETGAELQELMGRIVALTDSENGLLSARRTYLVDAAKAAENAKTARDRLAAIADEAQGSGAAAVSFVVRSGNDILRDTETTRSWMRLIAFVSFGVMLVAMGLTWWMIMRPLSRLTQMTFRLARGDLSEVGGLQRAGGEIGQMAQALGVFRTGLIERQEMERHERERAVREREAEKQAAREKREAEEHAAQEKRRQREMEEQRAAEEEARRRKIEEAAQAEREARAAELNLVVTNLETALTQLSEGNLLAVIGTEFPPAYEELRTDFNMALDTLSGLIQSMKDSASNVSASASDIASAAQEMATQTEHTAAALENSTSAVTELDASAKSMSERSNTANQIMAETQQRAHSSKSTVEAAVNTMSAIEGSSREISKIVDLIEDIAFQTNLLALNAGVEAARAGEQGRGFVVVATEVRALAQRSSDAAAEINGLISSTRDQITKGATEVGEAGQALVGILQSIETVTDSMNEIASGAHEQSATISEISGSLGRVQDTTQQAAARFEEALATSELLKAEARGLEDLSNGFVTEAGTDEQIRRAS